MSCGVFLRPFIILLFFGKCLFEPAINFAQFPENQNKQNCNYEQQELDVHLLASVAQKLETRRPVPCTVVRSQQLPPSNTSSRSTPILLTVASKLGDPPRGSVRCVANTILHSQTPYC